MRRDGFDELIPDAVERIEAGERVLEHHADALAADFAHLFRRQIVDALPAQPDLAARDAAGRLDQTDDCRAGDRLAGARLTNHAEHFAGADVERHIEILCNNEEERFTGVKHCAAFPDSSLAELRRLIDALDIAQCLTPVKRSSSLL